MSARDESVEMIRRICPAHLSADEYGQILAEKFDAHRVEALAEVMRWLGKKAREYRATGRKADAERADLIGRLASQISRGAVRPNNTMLPAGVEPLFFEPGRTYQRDNQPFDDTTWTFKVAAVATDPHGRGVAFGFLSRDDALWIGHGEGSESWAKDGWTEVTEGGEGL